MHRTPLAALIGLLSSLAQSPAVLAHDHAHHHHGETKTAADTRHGSAAEAQAMLDKAVAAIKADKARALAQLRSGEGGFRDRDLYPFCADAADGVITAHPTHLGQSLKDMKDVTGFAFGPEMLKVAVSERLTLVAYKWPLPGTEAPVQKVAFVVKVAGQVCGVGYYR